MAKHQAINLATKIIVMKAVEAKTLTFNVHTYGLESQVIPFNFQKGVACETMDIVQYQLM